MEKVQINILVNAKNREYIKRRRKCIENKTKRRIHIISSPAKNIITFNFMDNNGRKKTGAHAHTQQITQSFWLFAVQKLLKLFHFIVRKTRQGKARHIIKNENDFPHINKSKLKTMMLLPQFWYLPTCQTLLFLVHALELWTRRTKSSY